MSGGDGYGAGALSLLRAPQTPTDALQEQTQEVWTRLGNLNLRSSPKKKLPMIELSYSFWVRSPKGRAD